MTSIECAFPCVQPASVAHALRTGTDKLPILNPVLGNGQPAVGGHKGHQGHASKQDYGALSTPGVWRSARTQAAAKVEALSSNGMDEIEIPTFLRKQAD